MHFGGCNSREIYEEAKDFQEGLVTAGKMKNGDILRQMGWK